MNISLSIFALMASLAPLSVSYAAQPHDRLDCMIQPDQNVQLGSSSPGVIAQVLVQRGDLVEKGQVLARLHSELEQAALAVAQERAAQVGEATVANSSKRLATRELARANELFDQQYVSRTYLDKQRAEAQAAGGRSTQARENRRLARRQLQLAQTQLAQRSIRAPFAGVIVEQFMAPGEFIDQKPVMRLASVDPLRVDVLVPASAFGQVQVGMAGQVFPEMIGAKPREAIVSTVDRLIDAASNTFRVRLTLDNPDQVLPAGLRCQVDLFLPSVDSDGQSNPSYRRNNVAQADKSR